MYRFKFICRHNKDRTMLWHVENTNLHLLGSIHALRRDQSGLHQKATEAYTKATCVTFESDLGSSPAAELFENSQGELLSTRVPATVFANALREWVDLGLEAERLEQLQPWAAAQAMILIAAARRGIDVAHGIDKTLWERAGQDGKIRHSLEGQRDGLAAFAAFPPNEQSWLLDRATNPPTVAQNDVDRLIKVWAEGDEVAISGMLDDRFAVLPVGFRKLITDRNKAWMPPLLQLIADAVPVLVVVGILHLVGQHGLPKLLREKGFSVARIA